MVTMIGLALAYPTTMEVIIITMVIIIMEIKYNKLKF
jgi:hypothetical protein